MGRKKSVRRKIKAFMMWTFVLLLIYIPEPILVAAEETKEQAQDPEKVINTVVKAIIGVGVGIATAICIANAIFTIIGNMSNQEGHNRIELKEKLQYLVILEILALSIGGIMWWVAGLV